MEENKKVSWKDYLAIAIAALQTMLLSFILLLMAMSIIVLVFMLL
jgi:hypothetical protein